MCDNNCFKCNNNLCSLMSRTGRDYDCWDTTIDACVTICSPVDVYTEDLDWYEKFLIDLTRCIWVVEPPENEYDCSITCDWYGFFEENLEKFRKFSRQYCPGIAGKEKDDFIERWIGKMNSLCAGYSDESVYEALDKLVLDLPQAI